MNALIQWVQAVTTILLYIGQSAPHAMRVSLSEASAGLIDELKAFAKGKDK